LSDTIARDAVPVETVRPKVIVTSGTSAAWRAEPGPGDRLTSG